MLLAPSSLVRRDGSVDGPDRGRRSTTRSVGQRLCSGATRRRGPSPFRPAAAQIDQLHPAAGAKSSLLSAAAVTRNLEMPSNRSPTAQQIAGAKYLKFIECIENMH